MKSRLLQTSWLGPDDRFQRLKLLVDFLSDVGDLLVELGYASFHRARYFADFIADIRQKFACPDLLHSL